MTRLITPLVKEFYEEGLCNILRLIPKNMPEEERLLIEAVIYSGYGYFRSYWALENLLEGSTSDDGAFSHSYQANRDVFLHAWSLVDSAYALYTLSKLKRTNEVFSLSTETHSYLKDACTLRNYMDHLSANFRNAANATNFAPLFGWLSYQFTPVMRDSSKSAKVVYVTNIASTHIKDSYQVNVAENCSDIVIGAIDNVTIHIRRSDKVNLSRIFGNLTLDLNDFSIQTQNSLMGRLQDQSFDHGGLRIPFPQVVARGDLDNPVGKYDVVAPLEANKVRAEVHLDDEQCLGAPSMP